MIKKKGNKLNAQGRFEPGTFSFSAFRINHYTTNGWLKRSANFAVYKAHAYV